MTLKKQKKMPQVKKKSNHYFTSDHEEAILKFCSSTNSNERDVLYLDYIQPAFNEMVDKIVFTYKFNLLPNIDLLRNECKDWLIIILNKFDPKKGYKAFSYFSVITKNWFIYQVKRCAREVKNEDYNGPFKNQIDFSKFIEYNQYEELREEQEFWQYFKKEFYSWESNATRKHEVLVYDALKILFDSIDDIEIFNKKAIYLYIREMTGLSTKQIAVVLKKFREKYFIFKKTWDNGDI